MTLDRDNELLVLLKVLVLLGYNGENWVKGKGHSGLSDKRCLIGAVCSATSSLKVPIETEGRVIKALEKKADLIWDDPTHVELRPLALWNDARERTFEEVRELVMDTIDEIQAQG